ncbi:cache domain-containing protein [Candidatus Nitrosocosmicus hydrocola]|uniref:cache domain-containing protein n=1 Tax=Candidatus Nitrosocosmicus hydrocola TaxID=1826872 RepID=UPI0011E5D9D8|nr:cache domain-containing protein [Candidatus Nitrosocosmicus hydrocola]
MSSSKIISSLLIIATFVAIIHASSTYSTELYTQGFGNRIETSNLEANPNPDKVLALNIFADVVRDRINSIINILEFSSNNQVLSTLPYLSNVSETNHGIPAHLDYGKRLAIDNILKIIPDIASIYFVLPDGNIYLGEPFAHQEQLPRLNFADREWYIGVTETNSTYVSSIFLSASINAPAIAVAVPVLPGNHSDNILLTSEETPLGYLVGIVNLESVKEAIKKIDTNAIGRFLVIDRNGTELVNPFDSSTNNTLDKYDYFDLLDDDLIQLGFPSNQTFVYDQNNTSVYYKPITFEGGKLIAVLETDN